ncbi:MAG: DUF937 domain-containing protein [Stenotrophobium sp.]
MSILDTILESQGGQIASKLAGQFGIDPQQAQQTLSNVVPSLVGSVKNAVAQPGGLQKLHEVLQAGNYQQYLGNISQAFSAEGIASGQQALAQVFSGDAVSQITAKASAATGLATDKINQILPVITTQVMGVLNKVQQSPVGEMVESAMNSSLGKMATGLLGGGSSAGGGFDPLAAVKSVLDAHGGGGLADEVKGLAGKFFK